MPTHRVDEGKLMELRVERRDQATVVKIGGEHLDASNAGIFKQDMGPILEQNSKLALDFSGIRFMDSSGLGAILSCLRRMTPAGGELKLCCMTKPVRTLFELVRMDRIFDIYDTVEEAVAALHE